MKRDDKRMPIDKAYKALIGAIRAEAKKLVTECQEDVKEAEIAELLFQHGAKNAAWGILRISHGCGMFLFFGQHTMGQELKPFVGSEGPGTKIVMVPWEEDLLGPMRNMAAADRQGYEYCTCGHRLDGKDVRCSHGNFVFILVCPACGKTDADEDVQMDIDACAEETEDYDDEGDSYEA